MRRYLAALLLLGAVPAHAQTAPILEPYRIDEHGGGLGVVIDQTVVFLQSGTRWIAERSRHDRNLSGETRKHDWIDGAACPQLAGALRDLSLVNPRRFASPDVNDYWTLSDATLLTILGHPEPALQHSGIGGEEGMWIREYSGPYRDWWSKTEKALAGCWKPQAPLIDGKPFAPRLAEQP